ncbi:amidohydrolase family protein, partial [bacterium]|nr:amidohydrolase family protein [bacterium]
GTPSGGWIPGQRINLLNALKSFTVNAAYASFREDSLGSLENGKFADFVIISDNIFEIPTEQIPDLRVLGTIHGGNIVYTSGDLPF